MKAVKQKAIHKIHFIDDAGLNKIHTVRTDKRMTVSLQLRAEGGRKRKIGVITLSTKTMFIKRSREKHLFRKFNAYGFNNFILETATSFDYINLQDDFEKWKIPVEFILKNGSFLNYKEEGFELQIFVSLSQIEQFRDKQGKL